MALLVVQNIKIKNDYHKFLNQHVGEIESMIYMLKKDKWKTKEMQFVRNMNRLLLNAATIEYIQEKATNLGAGQELRKKIWH